jgi:hypothetical protein
MTAITVYLIIGMMVLNAASWFYPDIAHNGFAVRLTNEAFQIFASMLQPSPRGNRGMVSNSVSQSPNAP